MAEGYLTSEDKLLFPEIAADIKHNRDDYTEAGKWFDKYCTKDGFRERTRECIKKYEKDIEIYDVPLQDDIEVMKYMLDTEIYLSPYDIKLNEYNEILLEDSKKLIDNSKKWSYSYVYLWRDAIWHLIGNWSDIPSLGIKDSKRVLLITWLLTGPDLKPDSSDPVITEFEKMPTEKRGYLYRDIFILGGDRCQEWIDATRLAWHTVKIESKKSEITEPPIDEHRGTDKKDKAEKKSKRKRRTRQPKITDKQKSIWEQIERGATIAELAADIGCSETNIRQQYTKAKKKLKASSRSLNFKKTQKLPTDKHGQETSEGKGK